MVYEMLCVLKTVVKTPIAHVHKFNTLPIRNLLSPSYYCNEVWEHRLRNPIISKVNIDKLYEEIDQRYNKTGQISAVDVDIFANALKDVSYIDELIDLLNKLRLSAFTSNILDSTTHALIRLLMHHDKYDMLLKLLSDRLNYGIFLDYYTSNILMDTFYKIKDFTSGACIASHLMLQEEFVHPLSVNLGLFHCYKYLLNPRNWPKDLQDEEPEEETKIRVKYLRNPYFDDHFDLSDPIKMIGKTLWKCTDGKDSILDNSLHILGLELHGKTEKASELSEKSIIKNKKLYAEILNLLPQNNIRKSVANIIESGNIEQLFTNRIKEAEQKVCEKDISLQCDKYIKWEYIRKEEIEKQHNRLLVQQKFENIENIKNKLHECETKLWFFENQEKLELAIKAKQIFYPKRWFGKKKKPKRIDKGYVPPEIK